MACPTLNYPANPGIPPAVFADRTARRTAIAMASAAATPTPSTDARSLPSEMANVMSPSAMVLTGEMVRATPRLAERRQLVGLDPIEASVGRHDRDHGVTA